MVQCWEASNSKHAQGGNRAGRRCRGSVAQPPVVLTAPHRMTYRTSPPLPSPPTNQPTHSFPPLLLLQLLPISRSAPPRRRLPPFPTPPVSDPAHAAPLIRPCTCLAVSTSCLLACKIDSFVCCFYFGFSSFPFVVAAYGFQGRFS
jgi:hypothetical protein